MSRPLAERYRIERKLGEGGFGTVYQAFDLKNQRAVALKVLKPGPDGQDIARVSRFRREARAIASLQDPHIVQLFDFGHTESGEFFMACELVEGADLGEICESRRFSEAEAARLLFEILRALEEAHSAGLLHRDIKPQNIRIRTDGVAKLLDFGLVQQTDGTEQGLTKTGQVIGTPRYMSPEQLAGIDLEPSTDIYSLGLTVAEALIGKASFRRNQVSADLVNAGVGSRLTNILSRMSELDVTRRYASASDVLRDLRQSSKVAEPPIPPSTSIREREGDRQQRRLPRTSEPGKRTQFVWPAVAVVALVAAGSVFAITARPPPPKVPPPLVSAVDRLNRPEEPKSVVPSVLGPCERADRYQPVDSVTLTTGLIQRTIDLHLPEGVPVGHRMPLILSNRPKEDLLETARIHRAIILPHTQFDERSALGDVVEALKQRYCIGPVVRLGGMPRFAHHMPLDSEACLLADMSVSDWNQRCFPPHSVKIAPDYDSDTWLKSVEGADYQGACASKTRSPDECEPPVAAGKCAMSTCSKTQMYCKVAGDWKVPDKMRFCGQVPQTMWTEAVGFLLESWAVREDLE